MFSLFSCVCWPSVCLLWRNVYLDFLLIFWLSCLFSWYWAAWATKEVNPLSVASFANIFSHSDGCLFVLFMVSFAVQKLLSLSRSHLFIFVFILITLGGGSQKILLWFMSKSVRPMFSSKSLNHFLNLFLETEFFQQALIVRLIFNLFSIESVWNSLP